jgi:hypothetical protein
VGKLDICMYKTKARSFALFCSKWIKELNISPETLKLLQERIQNTLEQEGIGKNEIFSSASK